MHVRMHARRKHVNTHCTSGCGHLVRHTADDQKVAHVQLHRFLKT